MKGLIYIIVLLNFIFSQIPWYEYKIDPTFEIGEGLGSYYPEYLDYNPRFSFGEDISISGISFVTSFRYLNENENNYSDLEFYTIIQKFGEEWLLSKLELGNENRIGKFYNNDFIYSIGESYNYGSSYIKLLEYNPEDIDLESFWSCCTEYIWPDGIYDESLHQYELGKYSAYNGYYFATSGCLYPNIVADDDTPNCKLSIYSPEDYTNTPTIYPNLPNVADQIHLSENNWLIYSFINENGQRHVGSARPVANPDFASSITTVFSGVPINHSEEFDSIDVLNNSNLGYQIAEDGIGNLILSAENDMDGISAIYSYSIEPFFDPSTNSNYRYIYNGQKIQSPFLQGNEFFGEVLRVNDGFMAVSNLNDSSVCDQCGRVYIYKQDAIGQWNYYKSIVSSDIKSGDGFAKGLDINENYTIIGAPHKNNNIGRIYIYETQDTSLQANFAGDKVFGNAPLTIQFNEFSQGSPTSWQWDFNNDGVIDSYERTPIYTFNQQGDYSITLHVMDNFGNQDSFTKENYISVYNTLLQGDFTQNGIVNVVDILNLLNKILNYLMVTEYQLNSCDLNNDYILDISDIILIVNIILGN